MLGLMLQPRWQEFGKENEGAEFSAPSKITYMCCIEPG